MRPTATGRFGPAGRLAGALLAVGLVLAAGAPTILAADPPPPPTIRDLRPAGRIGLTFFWSVSGQQRFDGIRLNFYEGDVFAFYFNHPTKGERSGGFGAQFPNDLKPNTRYCVGLKAYVGDGSNSNSTFSEESERLCFTTPPREGGATAPAPKPADLQVAKVEVQSDAGAFGCVAGKANAVQTVIKNAGDVEVGAVITLQLSIDGEPAGTVTMGGVGAPPNNEKTAYFSNVNLTRVTHTIRVTVDPDNNVAEGDEANNTSPPLTVICAQGAPTKPDLGIGRVSGPKEVFDGATAVYEVVLFNEGTAANGNAQVTINAVDGLDPEQMVETPAGFTCEPHPLGGFSCTGSLAGVESPRPQRVVIFKLQARGNKAGLDPGPGTASVYGLANHDGSLDEMEDGESNVKLLQEITVK